MPSYSKSLSSATAYANGEVRFYDINADKDFSGHLKHGHYDDYYPWSSTAYASQTASDTTDSVVFPRPDSETSTYARHRWAHPDMDYIIPIALKHGAFPYFLEVDTTNTDAALVGNIVLGATHDATDAYTVRIPAATISGLTAGAKNVYIKAIDQNGSELKIWWTITKEVAELDHFFFVDSSYTGGTKDGKFDTPFDNASEAGWLASADGASSEEKILVLKEGNSLTTPYTKTADWNFSTGGSGSFPCAIIGLYGEEPVMSLGGTRVMWGWNNSTSNDGFFAGFKLESLNTTFADTTGAIAKEFANAWDRACIWNLTIDATGVTFSPTANNPSVIPMGNSSGTDARDHIAILDCRYDGAAGGAGSNTGAVVYLNGVRNCLIDNLTVSNWGLTTQSFTLIFVKRNATQLTVRRVTAIDTVDVSSTMMDLTASNAATNNPGIYEGTEILRNNFDTSATTSLGYLLSDTNLSGQDELYIGFNTFQGGVVTLDSSNADEIMITNNATTETLPTAEVTLSSAGGTAVTPTLVENEEEMLAGDFETDGTVTTTYLTNNSLTRGKVGHEIA